MKRKADSAALGADEPEANGQKESTKNRKVRGPDKSKKRPAEGDAGSKREKKRQKQATDASQNGTEPLAQPEPGKSDEKGERKKKKKQKRSLEEKDQSSGSKKAAEPAPEDSLREAHPPAHPGQYNGGKNQRFIAFIGNLPFSATKDAIYEHFASVHPTDVRLLTKRDDPSKSRGVAFVEFARFDHMKTCLEKFHHSAFDDGVSPARKINVELTAGGGGKKSNVRREKIKQKNSKLNEQRVRRMKEEEAAKNEKQDAKGADVEPKKEQPEDRDSVHPSRRGLVWDPQRRK